MIQPAMGSGESTNFFIGDSGLQDGIIKEIFESEVLKGKEHQG